MNFKLENVSLDFGDKKIFENINFILNEGDKIGIIGDNGSGKTSFFNIILNKVNYSGNVLIENNNFGYLNQDESFTEFTLIEKRKNEIENLLLKEEIINDFEKYNKLLNEYNEICSHENQNNEKELINEFKFNSQLYESEQKQNLSGGESTKLKLIKLFAKNYDYYLLDEPSNHLDIETKNILINKLLSKKSYVIISHDIELLNKCCNKIIEIKNNSIETYFGNYDFYLEQKEKEKENISKIQTENRKEKNKLENNLQEINSWSHKKIKEKTKDFKQGQVLRNMGLGKGSMEVGISNTSKRINQIQGKIDDIKDIKLDKEENIKIKYFDFIKPNKEVLEINNLTRKLNTFELNVKHFTLYSNEKVALQGKNGSGKSTLLKIIIGHIVCDKGQLEIGNKVKMGYLSQKNETLNLNNSIIKEILNLKLNLDESEIRKYLGKFLFKKNDIYKTIKNLSGGEKIRLALLKLILNGSNFLILDEPSNHLDIKSKQILSEALNEFPGPILVVSHDNFFLEQFITKKIKMENGKIIE